VVFFSEYTAHASDAVLFCSNYSCSIEQTAVDQPSNLSACPRSRSIRYTLCIIKQQVTRCCVNTREEICTTDRCHVSMARKYSQLCLKNRIWPSANFLTNRCTAGRYTHAQHNKRGESLERNQIIFLAPNNQHARQNAESV